MWASRFRLRACGSRTSATVRQGRTNELPFQEHGTGRSLYPILQIKFPSLYLPGQCDVKVGQVHMVSLQDEVTIVE